MYHNAIYAQSGGVSAVINASACGVIETYRHNKSSINKLYAASNGILGVLQEELIDTDCETESDIRALYSTPSGAFGSCRFKLSSLKHNIREYQRILEVFAAYQIGYFFYNGGNDSADTCLKISQIAHEMGYPIKAIHIPKTIDNDLAVTDNCPGFGSVAKYVATSVMEAGLDLWAMHSNSTKVFILEVMGRNTGWIAAATGLAATDPSLPPHIILFPERLFNPQLFLIQVKNVVNNYGYCVITVAEGLKDQTYNYLNQNAQSINNRDGFGHQKLGGVAPYLAELIKNQLGFKYHYAIADYLQRSARHLASKVDLEQAYGVGVAAVKLALAGKNAVMPYIKRIATCPYRWEIKDIALTEVANIEKTMPDEFISVNGFHITEQCREYIQPLIMGEDYPSFIQGLPFYVRLKNIKLAKKLPVFDINISPLSDHCSKNDTTTT